jgi:hypothetical protein
MDLNKFFRIIQLFFEAPDAVASGGATELSINDMVDELAADDKKIDDEGKEKKENDLLADDDEKKDEKKAKKSDDSEDEELEIDEDKVELDDLDAVEDVPRKEILAKYPKIFKDFPQLEKAYYREQKYAELLPTLDDAKDAVTKSEQYDKFEQTLLAGDIDSILNSVKTADSKAFNKIVDEYLPTLQKVDQAAYFHVIGHVIKNTIVAMSRHGKEIENEDLQGAAVLLNQFVFGKNQFEAPKEFGPKPDKTGDDTVDNERAQLHQERFESALEDLSSTSGNIIKSTIAKHIDPKDSMTDYVKRTAIRDALDDVDKAIKADSRFQATLDKLWERASKAKFNRESLNEIKRAHLNKAKSLLPGIISKHRSEALKGLGKREGTEREEVEKKGPVKMGRSGGANNTTKDEKTEIPKNKSTLDVLMED